jgi:diguanylate cyclase (GGDEF)-like protein
MSSPGPNNPAWLFFRTSASSMSEPISRVADLTGERDRDLLGVSMAEVLFKLLGARVLNLWHIVEHQQVPHARLMAGLRDNQPIAMYDPMMEALECPLLSDMEGVHECWRSASPVRTEALDGEGSVHYFPLHGATTVSSVLEVEHERILDHAQHELVDGMLRIYRNHVALLDYSEQDTLTGLLNRKTFDAVFARRIAQRSVGERASRMIQLIGRRRNALPHESPWLAVVDIDFFKRINDKFGHLFGDEVLLLTARLMRNCFRGSDTLFRFGGEEFLVLLSPTDEAGANVALERFRKQLEDYDFPQVGHVTVSIGYSRAAQGDNPTVSFERADDALYYAKQNGRNQVRGYEALVAAGALEPKVSPESELELF